MTRLKRLTRGKTAGEAALFPIRSSVTCNFPLVILQLRRICARSLRENRLRVRSTNIALLSVRVHPIEADNSNVRSSRSFSGCHAATHRLGRSIRPIEYRGGNPLRHALPVAVSALHGNRMDVPRRLRPRGLSGSAEGQCESTLRDFRNSTAAPCSRGPQHHAIANTARGGLLLCSGSSGNRIHILRMGIRVRAFERCCTPAAHGVDCLSSTVVRTKRDVLQSGQMIRCPDVPADSNKEATHEQ
jgi:hypothetical protein